MNTVDGAPAPQVQDRHAYSFMRNTSSAAAQLPAFS
jgi:hypothetical protein